MNEIGIPALIVGMDTFLWAFLVFTGLAIYLIVCRKHAPKESMAPLPVKSTVQATRTGFIKSQIAATIVGTLFVVFSSLLAYGPHYSLRCLVFMNYFVCLWPAVAFPMFFGYVFGPVVGFTTGFLGGIIIGILFGEIWLSLDIVFGFKGLLMGLATLILPEKERRESTGLLWCALLAVVSSFISASFAYLIDRFTGHDLYILSASPGLYIYILSVPPGLYILSNSPGLYILSAGVSDAINGAVFTPLITFIYYRIKQAVAVAEVPGKPERGAPVSVPVVPQPPPRGIKPITSVSAGMPLPTGYLTSELARLNEEAKQYREYLTRLEAFKAEGKVTEAVYEQLRREYMGKLEEIEQKMKQLTAR